MTETAPAKKAPAKKAARKPAASATDPTRLAYTTDVSEVRAQSRRARIEQTIRDLVTAEVNVARSPKAAKLEGLFPAGTYGSVQASLDVHADEQAGNADRMRRRLDRLRAAAPEVTDDDVARVRQTELETWRAGIEQEHAATAAALEDLRAEADDLGDDEVDAHAELVRQLETALATICVSHGVAGDMLADT